MLQVEDIWHKALTEQHGIPINTLNYYNSAPMLVQTQSLQEMFVLSARFL